MQEDQFYSTHEELPVNLPVPGGEALLPPPPPPPSAGAGVSGADFATARRPEPATTARPRLQADPYIQVEVQQLARDASALERVVAPPVVFSPDCPVFREQVEDAIADYAAAANYFKEVSEAAKVYRQKCQELHEAGRVLSGKMKRATKPAWIAKMTEVSSRRFGGEKDVDLVSKLGDIAHVMSEFGSMVEQLSSAHHSLGDAMDQFFIARMDHFAAGQQNELRRMHKDFNNQAESFEGALGRFLHGNVRAGRHNQHIEPTVQARAREVTRTRETFEISRFRMVSKLAELKARLNFEMSESLTMFYHATWNSCKNSCESLARWEPYVQTLHSTSGDKRRVFESETKERDNLLSRIKTALWVENAYDTRFSENHGEGNFSFSTQSQGQAGWGHHFGFGGEKGSNADKDDAVRENRENSHFTLSAGGKASAERAQLIAKHSAEAEEHFQTFARAKKLKTYFAPVPRSSDKKILREGWLYKKSSSSVMSNHWNRRWFLLDGSRLYYLRDKAGRETKEDEDSSGKHDEGEKGDRVLVCDCLLATVREVHQNPELRFCFEILSANRRSYMLQAEGPDELAAWVEAIRSCIARQLATGESETRGSEDGDAEGPGCGYREAVNELCRRSSRCADCDAADPDWVIINIGCLVCIECSGIHRSLGVHVSKVRSVVLDRLDAVDMRVLRRLGNYAVNRLMEAGLPSQTGWKRPVVGDSRADKEKFIRSKYVYRGFTSGEVGSVPYIDATSMSPVISGVSSLGGPTSTLPPPPPPGPAPTLVLGTALPTDRAPMHTSDAAVLSLALDATIPPPPPPAELCSLPEDPYMPRMSRLTSAASSVEGSRPSLEKIEAENVNEYLYLAASKDNLQGTATSRRFCSLFSCCSREGADLARVSRCSHSRR